MSTVNHSVANDPKRILQLLERYKRRVTELEDGRHEPIAVVGIGCRLPGDVSDPEGFWRLLAARVDAVTEVPSDRWDMAAYYDPKPEVPGKTSVRQGAFLASKPDQFDPQFFGISPREAVRLDPQQRLVLEVAWEALEHAGVVPGAGALTGVFVGIGRSDYGEFLESQPLETLDVYALTGMAPSFSAGRLSYVLGLQGPSLAVDTTCSSSLVAIHLACQSLRAGECRVALAGGVQLMLSPFLYVVLSRIHAISPDGRCKTFSAAADGYGRGEGCGMVVLKRLSDAKREGDRILAVIRGSAVNHDGRSSGLTVPNGKAQQAVVRQALSDARLSPGDIDYVEAHGTGTALGDPIEVEALAAVYGADRPADRPLRLGSVKTNIGHLEAAAGVAGLMKVVLSLMHGEIPAQLHARVLNPHIPWAELPVAVTTAAEVWPREGERPRRAGVSAFGLSGTNAHVILEEAPEREEEAPAVEGALVVVPLSAKSAEALSALTEAYRRFLSQAPAKASTRLVDIAYTASVRRSHHEHRLALVGRTREELAELLGAFERGQAHPAVARGQAKTGMQPTVVFVFSGQGSQWAGMGRALLEEEPVFRAAIEACEPQVMREAGFSLFDELRAPEQSSRLDETEVLQPVLFAVQVALSALWKAWSVVPDAVVGHSVGEVAAAHVAGALSLEEAVRLVVARGRVMQRAAKLGKMAAVDLSTDEAARVLEGYEGRVEIAAVNDPCAVVLSGETAALVEVLERLSQQRVRYRELKVNYAFHSPQMGPLQPELRRALGELTPRRFEVGMYSTVTGARVSGEVLDAAYWARNLRETVQFARAVDAAVGDGHRIFLEVSPHPVLSVNVQQCLSAREASGRTIPSLRRGQEERRCLLQSLGALYASGYLVDWKRLHPSGGRCVSLPAYPWQRKRYWIDTSVAKPREKASVPDGASSTLLSLLDAKDAATFVAHLGLSAAFSADDLLAVSRVLAALRTKAQEGRLGAEIEPWLYALEWRSAPLSAPSPATAAGHWVVLVDEGGVGDRVAHALEAAGGTCSRVRRRAALEHLGADAWSVEPTAAGVEAWWSRRFSAQEAVRGVVHLWSLGEALQGEEGLNAALQRGVQSALACVQAVVKTAYGHPPKLWFVTRGAMPASAGDPVTAPEQAAVWGLGRVVALEQLKVWGGLIDLPSTPDEHVIGALVSQLLAPAGHDPVALRASGRLVQRLVLHPPSPKASGIWSTSGTVLITGDLSALALHVARWLSRQAVKHLVLMSRQGTATAEDALAVASLKELGASVTVVQADAADAKAMAWVLADIDARLPPLSAIFHVQGALDDRVLMQHDAARFAAVLASEAQAAWNLHVQTQHRPLDAFTLVSSVASALSSEGQGAHAAASAFLEAVAHARRAMGLPAQSVSWGPIQGAETTTDDMLEALEQRGTRALRPEAATYALTRVLTGEVAQVIVADVDWSRRRAISETGRQDSLLSEMPRAEEAPASAAVTFREELKAAPVGEHQRMLEQWLRKAVAQTLAFSDPEQVDLAASFFDLGMDSLMSVEVRNGVESSLGIVLSVNWMFDCPTLVSFAERLLREINLAAEPGDALAPRRPRAWSPLVKIQGAGEGTPFFCVHPFGGPVLGFIELARHLGTHRPFYGIQARGLDDDQEPDDHIETMAARYIEALRSVQPSGPYLLGGHSFGGLVAFEMAQQLVRVGDSVALLALLDGFIPSSVDVEYKKWTIIELNRMLHPKESFREDLLRKLEWNELMDHHVNDLIKTTGGLFGQSIKRLTPPHDHALWSYAIGLYSGKMTYFRAIEQPTEYPFGEVAEPHGTFYQPIGRLSSQLIEMHEVPGNHFTLLQEPHVRILAERLEECILKADLSSGASR